MDKRMARINEGKEGIMITYCEGGGEVELDNHDGYGEQLLE